MMPSRLIAVGDVHGCIAELDQLLDHLRLVAGDRIVFLGDYIDRGPDPYAVVARLLRLQAEHRDCVFLRGNHEAMFLSYLGFPEGSGGAVFRRNGGDATLRSYGIEDVPAAMAAQRIPREHIEFLRGLVLSHRWGRFLMVHAGVSPQRGLDEQIEEDLLWIREEFTAEAQPHDCTVVYGHSAGRQVEWQPPGKLGLDTGVVYGNRLSACDLRSGRLFQIARGGCAVAESRLPDFVEDVTAGPT